MESLLFVQRKSVNQWMNDYISPGPVGPVGDVLVNEKLKKSHPDLPPRYTFNSLKGRGIGLQDGTWYNYHNYGLAAQVERQTYYDQSTETVDHGVSHQDVRLQDLKADTRVLAAPQFGWKNQEATMLNARVTGEQFLPLPMGYQPEGIRRGPQPRTNTLVDNTEVLGPIQPVPKLRTLVGNYTNPDDVQVAQENIQRQEANPVQQRGFLGQGR